MGGIPMNAPSDNTAQKGPRGRWLTPARPGVQRLISPWEYRHLRVSGVTRAAAGGFQLGIGLVLLSLGRQAGTDQERGKMYRLSAWFLVPAAANLASGYWYATITPGASART
jgi:hypothetical protein